LDATPKAGNFREFVDHRRLSLFRQFLPEFGLKRTVARSVAEQSITRSQNSAARLKLSAELLGLSELYEALLANAQEVASPKAPWRLGQHPWNH